MFWVTLIGVILLIAWVVWVLYIVNPEQQVTVTLLLRVEHAEAWLDPFLRAVCHLFAQAGHLRLLDIWILAADEGAAVQNIVQRLAREHPVLYFRGQVTDIGTYLTQARGQVLWFFDLVAQNTPVTALQALEQLLLHAGPMSAGSVVLEDSPT